jgi:signal transduction histidine kinase
MFRSIFSKQLVVFISIIIFSYAVSGVTLFYTLDRYVSEEKIKSLEKSGEEISSYLEVYLENASNPVVEAMLLRVLELYSGNTSSYIWVVNNNGYIAYSSPSVQDMPDSIRKNIKVEGQYYKFADDRQYKKAFTGVDPVVERGDFYGLFKDTGWSWLMVEKPFKYTNKEGKTEIVAAVFLSTPITEINKTRTAVFNFFIISFSISVTISFALVYFFSLRLSKPLKQINNAAKVIAGGEFSKRLDINSRDEIGELAKSFNQMVTALENLEDMRRSFIANVSHELRTPMTSIKGFIEGILDGTIPPEKQRDYLMIVKDESVRLNRLVNDLLDLARMESGELKLNLKAFNINELLRRCVIKLENLIVSKNLQVEANFEEEDIYVNADPDAIERVVLNLIHNAVKFIPEGGKITISVSYHKDKVHVSIEDTGIGIDKDEIDRIWERFYKSDKSRSRDKTGTGLGLAIIKNLINDHHQNIWVESELGKGTKFTFTLERVYNDKNY